MFEFGVPDRGPIEVCYPGFEGLFIDQFTPFGLVPSFTTTPAMRLSDGVEKEPVERGTGRVNGEKSHFFAGIVLWFGWSERIRAFQ